MIIKVYYKGKLDGFADRYTNKYRKQGVNSIFDALKKPIDYEMLEKYECGEISYLNLLKDDILKDLELHDEYTEKDKEIDQRKKKEYEQKKADLKIGKDWDVVKQILKSINIVIPEKGENFVLFKAPFPAMEDKILSFESMYYKYPPNALEHYDEGYRFTKKQVNDLITWLKKGYWSQYGNPQGMDEKWPTIGRLLVGYFITFNSQFLFLEPPYTNMFCQSIKLSEMRCKKIDEIQDRFETYSFTEEQLNMILKWLILGIENTDMEFIVY